MEVFAGTGRSLTQFEDCNNALTACTEEIAACWEEVIDSGTIPSADACSAKAQCAGFFTSDPCSEFESIPAPLLVEDCATVSDLCEAIEALCIIVSVATDGAVPKSSCTREAQCNGPMADLLDDLC